MRPVFQGSHNAVRNTKMQHHAHFCIMQGPSLALRVVKDVNCVVHFFRCISVFLLKTVDFTFLCWQLESLHALVSFDVFRLKVPRLCCELCEVTQWFNRMMSSTV